MKIALILSGNLRNFDADNSDFFKISDYYAEVAKKYDLDVFCFTDDNNYIHNGKTHIKKTFENTVDMGNHKPDTEVVFHSGTEIVENILHKTFGNYLKKYKIIPYISSFVPIDILNPYHISFYEKQCRSTFQKNNIINYSYKLLGAYKLLEEYERETTIKYDIIMKSRFDCIPMDILECVDIREIDYTNTVVCSHWSGFVYEHIAIGNRKIMHHYCNYYNTISPNLFDEEHSRIYWRNDCLSIGENPGNYLDISDSVEYGLTYLIKNIHKYNVKDYGINFRYFIPGCF